MKRQRLILLGSAMATVLSAAQAQAAEGVVASIKPLHSLVAAVMEGVGTPGLLVQGAGSPHNHAMRPSEARMLEEATVVFWVGPDLEMFLEGALGSLAGDAAKVALAETPGLELLAFREGGPFEAHAHDHEGDDHGHDHDHAHHDDHDHDGDHEEARDHGHGQGHDHDHDHGEAHAHDDDHDHHDHAHGEFDMHLWLDPENARLMARQIAATLSEVDPENAASYRSNAEALDARLDTLVAEVNEMLAPVRGTPFIVFHDAYQYFEHRFDMPAAGSITVNPEVMPGAQRLTEIRDRITNRGAVCVFAEPQFEPRLIEVAVEGTDARSGVLDPLGAEIEDGPDLYFTLVGNLAGSLVECLSGEA